MLFFCTRLTLGGQAQVNYRVARAYLAHVYTCLCVYGRQAHVMRTTNLVAGGRAPPRTGDVPQVNELYA